MKIEHKLVSSTLYIGLSGELDECNAPKVRSTLDGLIEAYNMKKVIFELSELTFMDSTGIGVLIGRFKLLKSKCVPIFLANPTNIVDKVLKLSGIYEIMPKII